MPTTKVYGCGGKYSYLNFFPCSSCVSKYNQLNCDEILKQHRTSKHKEYFSDMNGHMWNKTPVEYYKFNRLTRILDVIRSRRAFALMSESEGSEYKDGEIDMEITIDIFEHGIGYPLIFVHKKTNEIICETCARKMNINELCNDFAFDIFYEGTDLTCDECSEIIESAYGEPDEHMDDYMSDR